MRAPLRQQPPPPHPAGERGSIQVNSPAWMVGHRAHFPGGYNVTGHGCWESGIDSQEDATPTCARHQPILSEISSSQVRFTGLMTKVGGLIYFDKSRAANTAAAVLSYSGPSLASLLP
jgi:hypothetical protein